MGGPTWIDPVHDAAGNMTTMPQSLDPTSTYTATYNAWNRLVSGESAGQTAVTTNEYDGLGQRIVRVDEAASDTFDYYYNDQWQLLEERKDADSDPLAQYVWHPYYIDALAVRYYDAATSGSQTRYFY